MQNPLESYRRTQRELRRQFDAFTRANCPTCPTPCCRRPARILPTDILLAEATGWRASLASTDTIPLTLASSSADAEGASACSGAASPPTAAPDMVAEVAGRLADALGNPPDASSDAEQDALPCEYLGQQGCTFPTDLRPFGCTTFICRYMYARLDRPTLTRIKRLVRELEDRHRLLLRTVRNVPWSEK